MLYIHTVIAKKRFPVRFFNPPNWENIFPNYDFFFIVN